MTREDTKRLKNETKLVWNGSLSEGPSNIISEKAMTRFLSGEFPSYAWINANGVSFDSFEAYRKTASRTVCTGNSTNYLIEDEDFSMIFSHTKTNNNLSISVYGKTEESVTAKAEALKKELATEEEDDGTTVPVGFWHQTMNGARYRVNDLKVPTWPAIEKNYTANTKASLDKLMKIDKLNESAGKIMIFHGPPGTGKTTLLRAIAKEWEKWCIVDCILDPERFFSDPTYMLEVALREPCYDDEEKSWRLILLEDCEVLLRKDASEAAGLGFSRLLNLSDGLLGQGMHLLIGITTNAPLDTLHPAITRPGRCLAQMEVGKLSYDEALDWAGLDSKLVIPSEGATLAELYALRNDTEVLEITDEFNDSTSNTGMYL